MKLYTASLGNLCRSSQMSVSNDPEHFFQTTASLETLAKRRLKSSNKNGNPLTLSSKILTFCLGPIETRGGLPRIFTAESGGLARRVNLEVCLRSSHAYSQTRETGHIFRGHTGPVTSVALNMGNLYTGSWDKTIKVWNIEV
jgi:WD40 repeat protein